MGEFNKILNMCRNVTEIHPIVEIFPSGKNGDLATIFSRVGIALSLHVIPAIILLNMDHYNFTRNWHMELCRAVICHCTDSCFHLYPRSEAVMVSGCGCVSRRAVLFFFRSGHGSDLGPVYVRKWPYDLTMSLSPATSAPVATLVDFHTLCWNAWNSGIILSKTSRAIHVGRVLTISVRLCPTVPPDIWTEFIILSC